MTHVSEERIRAMLRYKQLESESNSGVILTTLDELSSAVSSTEIKRYLDQQALQKAKADAERKYDNAEITFHEFNEYVDKHSKTMDLRTIQRWLTKFVQAGIVEKNITSIHYRSQARDMYDSENLQEVMDS